MNFCIFISGFRDSRFFFMAFQIQFFFVPGFLWLNVLSSFSLYSSLFISFFFWIPVFYSMILKFLLFISFFIPVFAQSFFWNQGFFYFLVFHVFILGFFCYSRCLFLAFWYFRCLFFDFLFLAFILFYLFFSSKVFLPSTDILGF